jgi:hypothetical protein
VGAVTRVVAFTAVHNFRDLGGYRGAGGRPTRWRTVFRADSLTGLEPTDHLRFAELGVRTVLDLRDEREIARHGRVADIGGLTWVNLAPAHTGLPWDRYRKGDDLVRFIADRYLLMAEDGRDAFGAALRLLAEPGRSPLVMHCQVGRDRTGVLAALLLGLLGVGDDVIAADYALSDAAEQRYNAWLRRTSPGQPLPEPHLVATPAGAMRLFLTDLRARHGSLPAYAANAGVDAGHVARLRDLLLAPSPCPVTEPRMP